MPNRVQLPASSRREHRYQPVHSPLRGYLNPPCEWDRQRDLARRVAPTT
ncbi:MAG: hypothetical protein U0X73_04010 [Thermoanaerobaculia bacterium]